MNYKAVINMLGRLLLVEAALILPSVLVAMIYGESVLAFAITIAILLVLGGLGMMVHPEKSNIYAREGFVIVALSWIIMSLIGCLPFLLSGYIPNFFDAFFEIVSGFTTTGASILPNVEVLPNSLLFWRSFTHWIGGMGVLVFVLAVMPMAKLRNVHIMRAEVPGPTKGKLVPRMQSSALILYGIYIAMTIIEIALLLAGGMPLFDALCNAFGTAGTGGFSIKAASIGYYNNVYFETVIGIFMLLFGINFNLYYLLLLKHFKEAFASEELRLYLGIVVVAVAMIAIDIYQMVGSAGQALRQSFFQVSSIITTTGYATTDFALWPSLARSVLVALMVTGACAGSTAGGIKISRVLILFKDGAREIYRLLHPNSVRVVRMDHHTLDEPTIKSALVFISMYFAILVISSVLICVDGNSLETSTTAVISCLGNVGPGLEVVGPAGNYGHFSNFVKALLSFNMLLGRLEIYPMLILFSPRTWVNR